MTDFTDEYAITKRIIQFSQGVKKSVCPQKGCYGKRCEIQGGGQEMFVMIS